MSRKNNGQLPEGLRQKIFLRDNYECQYPDCKEPTTKTNYLVVHHIDHDFGNKAEKNLTTFCAIAHRQETADHKRGKAQLARFEGSMKRYRTKQRLLISGQEV